MTDGEARTAIRHLQSIYNTAGDRGKIGEVLTTFAPDGTLEVPGAIHKGRDAIEHFLSGVAGGGAAAIDLRGSRHHLTTSRIDLEGANAAQGWTYFYVMRAGQVLQEGSYIDRYIRTDSGWQIAHRRVKILWTLGDPA